MKGKTIRKLAACAAAAAMILSMTVSVQATTIGEGGIGTVSGEKTEDTITIPKDVQVFNTAGHKIYAPKITYTYTVAPVTGLSNTTVTDINNNTAVVRDGVADVVTVSSPLDFSTDTEKYDTTTDSSVTNDTSITDVKKIRKNLVLSVDISSIEVPGIYRYKITDTTDSAALTAAGITRAADYNTVRYLDVYVVDNGSNGGVKLGGYVLFTAASEKASITTDTTTTTVSGGEKVPGYDVTSETTKETTEQTYLESKNKSDEYHTYNLKVTKEVTGSFGDRTHEFPFTVTTSGNSADYISQEKNGVQEAKATVDGTTSISASLKNGESFILYGLPNNTTYKIEETNNTKDTYKVTITDISAAQSNGTTQANGTILVQEASVAKDAKAALNNQSTATVATHNEYISVKFTNNLDSATPTGIFLRFAPYIIMAAAAVLLLIVMRRRKHEDKS